MESNREIIESPLYQGIEEQISYILDVAPWGSNPSLPSVKIYNMSYGSKIDTSSINISGSPIISGNNIILPTILNLVSRNRYYLEIKFVIDGNQLEAYGFIIGEDVI